MKLRLKLEGFVTTAIIAVILLLAFAVRLYKITSPVADWHSWRQVDTASVTRIYATEGLDILTPRYYDISSIQTGNFNPQGLRFVEFPLFNIAHLGLYRLLPFLSLEVTGRLTSILCSIVTTFFVYLLGKRLIGTIGGLSAAFFFAFLPYNIYFSRVILPEPMATMFAVLGIYFFLRYTDSNTKLFLFISAISFALGILVKPFIAFYGIVPVYLSIKKFGVWGSLRNIPLLLALDVALIPFFLWRMRIFDGIEGIPAYAWMFNGDGIRFRPAFWRWIFGERLGNLILGMWGLIPFGFGLLKKEKEALTINFMLLGMLLYVVVIATANVRHDYYQTIAIPAIALTLGKGVAAMLEGKNFRKILSSLVFLGAIVGLSFGLSFFQIKEDYKVNHPEFIRAGQVIDSIAPKDARVIAPNNGDTVLLYYTKRYGWPALDRSIDDAIALGARYFISTTKTDTDSVNFSKKYTTVYEDPQFFILDLHSPKSEKQR
jgi:hypothetical protein